MKRSFRGVVREWYHALELVGDLVKMLILIQ